MGELDRMVSKLADAKRQGVSFDEAWASVSKPNGWGETLRQTRDVWQSAYQDQLSSLSALSTLTEAPGHQALDRFSRVL